MKKASLHSTSHHSKIIPDRTRRAPPRVDTESSYGDGNISDSSTRPILSSKNKSAKSSEKSKGKEYAPAIGSGKRNKNTGSFREEEKKRRKPKPPKIPTPASEQQTKVPMKNNKYKLAKEIDAAQEQATWYEEQYSRNPYSHYEKTKDAWQKNVKDLKNLAEEIENIKSQHLSPRKAKQALDDLLDLKGHLLK
ncbi:hypothetical protein ACHAPC_008993 [Botrytis cinerea]